MSVPAMRCPPTFDVQATEAGQTPQRCSGPRKGPETGLRRSAVTLPLMPSAVRLQLVSPTRALPARAGWTYEPKLDGCRVLLGKAGDECQVRTRGGHLVQRALPE